MGDPGEVSPKPLSTPEEPGKPVATAGPGQARIEVKHLLAIRWFHWLNFPILFTMIWSGILIYWANDVYSLFGFPLALPDSGYKAFSWDHRLAEGMGWHFLFMWFFTINGILYVLFTAISGEWRYLVPNRESFKEAIQVVLFDLKIRKEPLPPRKYNGAQQIAYTSIIVMGIGSFVTGLAIYKPTQLSWPVFLGGYGVARFLHFWLMMGYVGFFCIHIMQVVRAGWNNFRGMLTGRELVTDPGMKDDPAAGGAKGGGSAPVEAAT